MDTIIVWRPCRLGLFADKSKDKSQAAQKAASKNSTAANKVSSSNGSSTPNRYCTPDPRTLRMMYCSHLLYNLIKSWSPGVRKFSRGLLFQTTRQINQSFIKVYLPYELCNQIEQCSRQESSYNSIKLSNCGEKCLERNHLWKAWLLQHTIARWPIKLAV